MTTRITETELQVAICSFSAFNPEMGIPVRTTVGYPRFWKGPKLENIPILAPHGIFRNAAFEGQPMEVMEAAYLERLDENAEEVLSELRRVADLHPGERLVLLCYENVHKGLACHRSWAGTWLTKHLALDVPEISPNSTASNKSAPLSPHG